MDIDERVFARIKKAKESNTDEITIRDYFAAKAMLQVMAVVLSERDTSKDDASIVAQAAYIMADAMLAERNKQNV